MEKKIEKKSKRRSFRDRGEKSEFDQQLVDIARVTRVMAGGKRMRFRACVVIGDRKGRVGFGLGKGKDVSMAVQKAVKKAEKTLIKVSMSGSTIPHEVRIKLGASRILLKPAPEGTGIISGGAVRTVLELAGIEDVVSKILGTNNKVSNVRASIKALDSLKPVKKENSKLASADDKIKKSKIEKSQEDKK